MFRELQVDTSELEKLKGISIGMTNDDQQFLVFTYEKRKMSERVLVVVWWLVFAVLYIACGFAIWWYLVR